MLYFYYLSNSFPGPSPAQRELIARAPNNALVDTRTQGISSSNEMACPECATFKKSGRASYCAPGGAWFKNCGGARNRNADHSWFEGIRACESKSWLTWSHDRCCRRRSNVCLRTFMLVLWPNPTHIHPQPRWRPSVPCAANTALSRNPGIEVVVVAVVLGLQTAGVANFITRGTRASKPAKQRLSPREPLAVGQTPFNC